MNMLLRAAAPLAVAGALLAAPAAVAQEDAATYPSKPVRLVVPTAPGGGNDASGRAVADWLSKEFGQPFVVENIAGAANTAGTAAVTAAAPDGYTLLSAGASPIAVAPFLYPDIPYKPSALAAVSQVTDSSRVLVVNPQKLDVKTLKEFVDLVKASPDKYNYGTNGIATTAHLTTELFMMSTGAKMVHVPFKGGPETMTAVLGGHVDAAFLNTTTANAQIREGTLRPLAVSTPDRVPDLPDVPTVSEIYPEFIGTSTWNGIFVPAGTPKPIIDKLSAAIVEFTKSEAGAKLAEAQGSRVIGSTPEAFAALVQTEIDVWAKVIKEAGIKPE